MRRSDQCRFRWVHKVSEINFQEFVEGRHIVNHVPQSGLLTNKFRFQEALGRLESLMAIGLIKSSVYRSVSEFTLDTYMLSKNRQLTTFMGLPNEGLWVLKNTTGDKVQGVTLVANISELKRRILQNLPNAKLCK